MHTDRQTHICTPVRSLTHPAVTAISILWHTQQQQFNNLTITNTKSIAIFTCIFFFAHYVMLDYLICLPRKFYYCYRIQSIWKVCIHANWVENWSMIVFFGIFFPSLKFLCNFYDIPNANIPLYIFILLLFVFSHTHAHISTAVIVAAAAAVAVQLNVVMTSLLFY